MGKKKENILDYLATGKEECFEHEYYGIAAEGRVRITTDTGVYEFPKTYLDKNYNQSDYKEVLLKDWNSAKRAMHDLDSVRIVRCCTDKEDLKAFGEAMLYLRDHPRDAQIYAAIYEKSKLVPQCLRQYLYDELRWWKREECVQKDGGKEMNTSISFEIAERMPMAFRKGWENVNLSGFNINNALKRLMPAFKLGEKVLGIFCNKATEGRITRIFAEKDRHDKHYVRYEVEYFDNYWYRRNEPQKDLLPVRVAV